MYYGQNETDRVIESYFDDIGVCVEVGAGDGCYLSNTLYFEEKNWQCLCIEPNPLYRRVFRKNWIECAVGDRNEDKVEFHVVEITGGKMEAVSALKIDRACYDFHKNLIQKELKINVKLRTLNRLLEENPSFQRVDFVSIDTEGTEIDVLKGFDLTRWKPKLLIVESNTHTPNITEFLRQFGYRKDRSNEINDFYLREATN